MRDGTDIKFAQLYYPSHMNSGHFLLSLLFGFFIVLKLDFSRLFSKLRLSLAVTGYISIIALLKIIVLKNLIKFSLINAIIGGYMKHHHGLFLPLLVYKFLLENRKVFNKNIFAVLEKLFTSTFLTSLLLMKFFIFNRNEMIEMNIVTLVRF